MSKTIYRVKLVIGNEEKDFTKDNGLRLIRASRQSLDNDGVPKYGLISQYCDIELIDRDNFIINRLKNKSLPPKMKIVVYKDYYSTYPNESATETKKIGTYTIFGTSGIKLDIYSSKISISASDLLQGLSDISIPEIPYTKSVSFQYILDWFMTYSNIIIKVKFSTSSYDLSKIGYIGSYFSMSSGNLYEKLDSFCAVLCARGYINENEELIIDSIL